jgi:alkanesulfonate monooxygenase SsuD/methylene tetrahydromethanopterin reductase-like flavin-dependent oxidoreductase (luciferase family)
VSEPSLGVMFRPQSAPEDLHDVVKRAEDAGVDELWLWEDCFAEGGPASAAAALAWTERLKIGIGLLPVPLRNPAATAMEIATLARLFPGRLRPGLGHGLREWMVQIGAGVASPMTLLREHTTAIRTLLHGGTVTSAGRYVQLDGVTLDWPPSEPPPLLVGGHGPKTLRLAGELADGVLLDTDLTADQVREAMKHVEEGRAAAGRTEEPFLVPLYIELDPTSSDLGDQMARRAAELGPAGATSVIFQFPGDAPDPTSLIEALRRS